jgi:hypothetical protein
MKQGGASNERYQQRRTDSVGAAVTPPLLNRGSRLTKEKLERGPSALIRHVWVAVLRPPMDVKRACMHAETPASPYPIREKVHAGTCGLGR